MVLALFFIMFFVYPTFLFRDSVMITLGLISNMCHGDPAKHGLLQLKEDVRD
jgi:hypothetical protein